MINPRSIELHGEGKRAALLLHGFTGSPSEMSAFGTFLNQSGFHVCIPLLPGHGTNAKDLDKTSYLEWLHFVKEAYQKLTKRYDEVFLAGLSMGCLLAINLARHHPEIKALALFSCPYWVQSKPTQILLSFLDRMNLWKILPKEHFRKPTNAPPDPNRFTYPVYPTNGLRSLIRLTNATRKDTLSIEQPVLFLHSRKDPVAPYASIQAWAKKISGPVDIYSLDGNEHVLTLKAKHQQIFQYALNFFNQFSQQKSADSEDL